MKFTFPIDTALAGFYGLTMNDWREYKERNKALAQPELGGKSLREAMIDYSENYIKKNYGPAAFGEASFRLIETIRKSLLDGLGIDRPVFVYSDAGFVDEVEYLSSRLGKENCLLIRLHRDNYDFIGDSRGYISVPNLITADVENNSSLEDLKSNLYGALRSHPKIKVKDILDGEVS